MSEEELEQLNNQNKKALGEFMMNVMDRMEDDYPEGVELGEMVFIAEIKGHYEDGDSWTGVRYLCTNPKNWAQVGLIRSALRIVERME